MRRIRLPVGRSVLFGCLTLLALVFLFPLSLALSAFGLKDSGLTARAARGSVWFGNLREANFGRLPLGDMTTALDPLPLFVGRARVDLAGPAGRGAFSISRHSFGVDDATAKLAAGRVFAPIPLDSIDFDDFSVRFRDDRCDTAEGRVRASFASEVAGLSLAQGLSGTARCDAGALLLPLVGQSGMESLTLRITGDGRYRAELNVRSSDPALAGQLTAAGFTPVAGGYALRLAGSL